MRFTTECNHCGATEFEIINKGPHRQLNCHVCKKYIKFISSIEEKYLMRSGQIMKSEKKNVA